MSMIHKNQGVHLYLAAPCSLELYVLFFLLFLYTLVLLKTHRERENIYSVRGGGDVVWCVCVADYIVTSK